MLFSRLHLFGSKQIQPLHASRNRPCLEICVPHGDSETNLDNTSCNFFFSACLLVFLHLMLAQRLRSDDCVFEALLTAKISLSFSTFQLFSKLV